MSDNKRSRRGFLGAIIGGSAVATLGSIIYPAIRFVFPPETAEAKLSQLKLSYGREEIEADPKKAKYFKYGRSLGMVFITSAGELKAVAATCTHLDCTVQHRPDLGIIWCSCHNGRYDHNGENISGPPPRPLAVFRVKEDGNDIFVSLDQS
ncbi:MAG: ubiquinol-cytochrome c reductase iron-sulfur subunit [Candidatus Zixiibacteriota bacterium]